MIRAMHTRAYKVPFLRCDDPNLNVYVVLSGGFLPSLEVVW